MAFRDINHLTPSEAQALVDYGKAAEPECAAWLASLGWTMTKGKGGLWPDYEIARGNKRAYVDVKRRPPTGDLLFINKAAICAYGLIEELSGLPAFVIAWPHQLVWLPEDIWRHSRGIVKRGAKGGSGRPYFEVTMQSGRPGLEVFG